MFCNSCGAPNPDVASFCNRCGKPVTRPPANPSAQSPASSVSPPSASAVAAAIGAVADTGTSVSTEKVRTLKGHSLFIYDLAFSPDGRWLVSGSQDKTAKLWDLSESRELRTFTGALAVVSAEFSPDGRCLAFSASGGAPFDSNTPAENCITLWNPASPDQVRNLKGHQGQAFCVKFNPDGGLLASSDGSAHINLWDVASGQIVKSFKHGWLQAKFFGGSIGRSLAFSPDGRCLATRSSPATLWDVSNGKEVRALGPERSTFFAMFLGFTPDGQNIVEARGNGVIKLWDAATGKQARCLMDPPATSGVTFRLHCAALSPDGCFLAVSTYSSADEPKEKVTLWDVNSGRTVGTVTGHHDCHALAFSRDGQWLAIGGMEYGGGTALGKIQIRRTAEIR